MNLQTLRRNGALRQQLASSYALGTLRGRARHRFEDWLAQDDELRRVVADWQDRLAPLAELAPAAAPPDAVWQAIERRLQLQPASASSRTVPAAAPSASAPNAPSSWQRWLHSLSFWRGLGIASTALAGVLVALLVGRQLAPVAPMPSYVALLADSSAHTAAIISGDAQRRQLTVRLVNKPQLAADQALELWAVPAAGTPRSLGVLAADGTITLPLPADATPDAIPLLAISLEPKGGSPNPNGPSGPILFKGAWVRL